MVCRQGIEQRFDRLGARPFLARERRVLSETEAYFTPEFMNRMDAVCIFHPLNRAVMADIARRLFLSEGTVRNYLSSAIGKTGARNRIEVAQAAEANGWLTADS